MIHAETRQRVSVIANKFWSILHNNITMHLQGDDTLVISNHAFDDHPHNKAVVTCSIDGDMVLVCSIVNVRVTFLVTGENKITIQASYRIGGPGSRPGTYIERSRELPLRLDTKDTEETVSKQAWSLLVNTLRPDVETLLAPYQAQAAAENHTRKLPINELYALAKALKPKLVGVRLDGHVVDDVRLPAAAPHRGDIEVVLELSSTTGHEVVTWDFEITSSHVITIAPNVHKEHDNRRIRAFKFTDVADLVEQLRQIFGPDFAQKGLL